MSDEPKEPKEFTLKGVIPPKKTKPEDFDKVIKGIRELHEQFPYLAEEVKRQREKELFGSQALTEMMNQESEFHALVEEIKQKREKELSELRALAEMMNQKSEFHALVEEIKQKREKELCDLKALAKVMD